MKKHSMQKLQNLSKESFHRKLNNELLKNDTSNAKFSDFNNAFVSVLNKRTP